MIKRFALQKIDSNGDAIVICRFRTIQSAINWYALFTALRFSFGIKDSIRYRIKELPIVYTVCKKNVSTKLSEDVKSYLYHDIAIYHCNNYNKYSDGTYFYYVKYSLAENN